MREAAPRAKDFTQHRRYRNRPLTDKQIEQNPTKSGVRAKVEHAFHVIKRTSDSRVADTMQSAQSETIMQAFEVTMGRPGGGSGTFKVVIHAATTDMARRIAESQYAGYSAQAVRSS